MFITMCLCVLDPVRHVLSMGNAGHPAPFLKRLGEANVMELIVPRGGLPLGIDVDTEYFPANFEIQPGDQILFFTDGATEAMDKSRDLLGTRALKKMLQRASGDIESVVRTIVNGIESYRQDTYVRDDMTLLGISRKSTE